MARDKNELDSPALRHELCFRLRATWFKVSLKVLYSDTKPVFILRLVKGMINQVFLNKLLIDRTAEKSTHVKLVFIIHDNAIYRSGVASFSFVLN